MSTDMAISLAKKFIRQISQPFDHTQTGISLWTLDDIEEKQRKDLEEEKRRGVAEGYIPLDLPAGDMRNGGGGDEEMEMEYGYDEGLDDDVLAGMEIPVDA